MRDLYLLNNYRLCTPHTLLMYGNYGDGSNGAFLVPSPIDRKPLKVIAARDEGWDHVSVSRENRIPNWLEMNEVRRLFFLPTETIIQIHPPVDKYVNIHPYVLHLWRPLEWEVKLPPSYLV